MQLDNIDTISSLSECSDLLYLIRDKEERLSIINRARAILKENMGNTSFQLEMIKIKTQYKARYFSPRKKHKIYENQNC